MSNIDFLRRVPIFADLDDEHLHPLPEKLHRRHYRKGEVIFHQDDPADCMHIVEEGSVKISIMSADGREKDIALLQEGECFGEMALLDNSNRSAMATCLDHSETLVLFRQDFLHFLCGYPEFASKIISLLAQRLRNANDTLGDMVFLDVPTRVAKELLVLVETYQKVSYDNKNIVIPIGQEELARLVGSNRETVSRALASYRRMGIVATSHGKITITDMPHLNRMAS